MKARVYVTLKPSVFDPQGRVVADALVTLGYQDVQDVRQGKFFEVELTAPDAATKRRALVLERMVSNDMITAQEAKAAGDTPLQLASGVVPAAER